MNKQPSVEEYLTVINIDRESNEELSDDETEISRNLPLKSYKKCNRRVSH